MAAPKSFPSSNVLPARTGTSRYRPDAIAVWWSTGSTAPSAITRGGSPRRVWARMTSPAGIDRSRSTEPASATNRSAYARAAAGVANCSPPLRGIALCIRPSLNGETMRAHTLTAPADSPITVTFPGSPPNVRALRLTKRSASSWSSVPKLPESPSGSPVPDPGRSSHPKTPTR
jgi:hypothetical protein